MADVKRVRVRGLTVRQARIITQLKGTPNIKVTSMKLGITSDAIYMSNTRVYQNFNSLLDIIIENYPTFKRRLEHDETICTRLRRLTRIINKGD